MSTTTPNLGLFKYNPTTDSAVPFNIDTALNANWDILDQRSGGTSRNLGELVSSTVPLIDAGLHLIDGALIPGSGIYSSFVNYMSDLYKTTGTNGLRLNPIMTSDSTPSGTVTYTGTLYDGSYPYIMLNTTTSCAWTTDSGSVTYTFAQDERPLAGTYRFFFNWGTYSVSGRSLSNVVITTTYEDNTTSTINVGNLTGTVATIENSYTSTNFTTTKKIKSFTISHSSSTVSTTTANIGNFHLQKMIPNYFITESDWQDSVTHHGVCGKFVYNYTDNSIRLPKITGIVEGTTDLTALGDLIKAGLPNITGTFQKDQILVQNYAEATGCVSYTTNLEQYNLAGGGAGNMISRVTIDASKSNSIYGNSTTVQPQTIKLLYYIVIGTTTKTNIEININNIINEWNNRYRYDSNTKTLYIGINNG